MLSALFQRGAQAVRKQGLELEGSGSLSGMIGKESRIRDGTSGWLGDGLRSRGSWSFSSGRSSGRNRGPSVRCLDCLAAMSGPIVFVYRHPHRYKALDCVIATVVEIQIPDPSTHASDLDSGWDQGLLKGCLGLVLEHHEVSHRRRVLDHVLGHVSRW